MGNQSELYVQALLRAAEQAGGREALARRLGLQRELLDLYLDGQRPIPAHVFLRTIDLLMAPARPPDIGV